MAQEKITVDQIFNLAQALSPEEQAELRRKLDESWGDQWDQLTSRIQERSKDLPPLTDEEIIAEVKAVKEERKARRAEGSH